MSSTDRRQLRNFGLLVGGIFVAIGLWPAIVRGASPRLWALVPGTALVVLGLVAPTTLTQIHRAWMTLAGALGWINSRIILSVVYIVIITPVGVIRRLRRKDPLGCEFQPNVDTYRVPRTRRSPTHLRHQF